MGGYQLLGRLGSGGMGQVFLGVSPSGRRVAVKLIHPVHAGQEHFRERFAREIEAARRVGGFHTAPVVDADPHAYMAPEQIRGDVATPAMDVFSLGCVLAFAVTGRPPFGSDTAAAVMFRIVGQPPDLAGVADGGVRDLIEGCLAKSPEDRLTVPAILAAATNRGPLPAAIAPRAVPVADGRGTQTHPPLGVATGTSPGRDIPPVSWTAAPGAPPETVPPGLTRPRMAPPPGVVMPGSTPSRTGPPSQPGHARPAGSRPGRRRAALIATLVCVVAAAVAIPVG